MTITIAIVIYVNIVIFDGFKSLIEEISLRLSIAVRYNADIVVPSHFLPSTCSTTQGIQVGKQHKPRQRISVFINDSLNFGFMFQYIINPSINLSQTTQRQTDTFLKDLPLNSRSLHTLNIR